MIKKIINNKLFKDSFIYVFTDVINKSIPFILLPFLTYYLTPEDYGIIATFNSLVAVTSIFIGLSIQGAISVNYYKLNKKELAQYVGNVIYILLVSFLFVSLIIIIFNNYLSKKIDLPFNWLIIAVTMSFTSFFVILNLSLWLVEQKPKYYGSFQIGETIIKLGLSLYFIIVLTMSWEGRIYGVFIGGSITALTSIYLLYKRNYLDFTFRKDYIKDALSFGIPLIPHQLSFWLRSGAIIFILAYIVGKKETGLYNIGSQFVIPISVLTAAFNKAWAPYLYRKLSKNPTLNTKHKIIKFTYLYFVGILILAYIITLVVPFLINLLLEKSFSESYVYVKYLAFAAAFQGMYFMVVNYIFFEKKTKYLAYITFFSSIINVSLAYYLITKNGAIGAAQAYLATSILTFFLVWYYSNKIYKMPWIFKIKI
jgi:O-antigen/teichoic acid export membrane protein